MKMYAPCHNPRRTVGRAAIALWLSLPFLAVVVAACGAAGGDLSIDDLSSLFQGSGFRLGEGPSPYDASNLYDRINGAAPAYMACGFESLTAYSIFDKGGEIEIALDIFDMGLGRNAFGIYSLERDRSGSGEEFGGGSCRSDGSLFFWQDKYYVKLVAYDLGPKVDGLLSRLAQIVSEAIPHRGTRPVEFTLFPEEDRIPYSERYIADAWLGQDDLSGGYTVDFVSGGREYSIGLITCADEKEARSDFEKFKSFVARGGEVVDLSSEFRAESFSGTMSFYGPLVAARRATRLIVILGLSVDDATPILTAMLASLTASPVQDSPARGAHPLQK